MRQPSSQPSSQPTGRQTSRASNRAFRLALKQAHLVALAMVALVAGCGEGQKPPPVPSAEAKLQLRPVSFQLVPGWSQDNQSEALVAFMRSCERLLPQPPDRPIGGDVPGTVGDFREPCLAARTVPQDPVAARRFFETYFAPYLATANGDATGLFTGYYEPILKGCLRPRTGCSVPLYRRPADLVEVDLGQFRESLKGQRVAGRVEGSKLVPYADRGAIDGGALLGRGLEIAFVEDGTEAFFLHVQGSGRIQLDDGRVLRVGYSGQNGFEYTSIGRELVRRGELTLDQASMQSIQTWVRRNPAKAAELFAANRSYVFFEPREGEGPLGTQGAPLTPGRSLAVDRRFVPLGLPLWVDLEFAGSPYQPGPADRIQRLMVAQDTGGAIKGAVRGDFFWGAGPQAGAFAGRMKSRGAYFLLLPRTLAQRVASLS
ncbi:MAG: murein transglycosylase A [Alphaproteobacteria bacterium]|nr:murein transglycosylase A [Alphaproteobacteria bacterium]